MSYDDLALTIFYLQTAITLSSTPTETVRKSVATLFKTQAGEDLEGEENLEKLYLKKFGLPATSGLLRFTPREIATWGQRRRRDLIESIKDKVRLMETHRDNPESWKRLEGKFRYVFIPLEHLP